MNDEYAYHKHNRLIGKEGTMKANRTESANFERLPALLSVTTAAQILGLSRASAYRYAAAGELPVKRLGGRIYIVTAKLLAFIDDAA